jgi:hypothetical protein
MSTIENHDKIDKMGIAKAGDCAVLMIVDPLTWDDPAYHVDQLEKKLTVYHAYVKTGQFLEDLPAAKDLPVVVHVLCQHPLPDVGQRAAESAKRAMATKSIDVSFVVI